MNHWKDHLYIGKQKLKTHYLQGKVKNDRTKNLFAYIHKHIVKLGKDSKVLELGCNVGRNLRHVSNTFGSYVEGYDICPEVIEVCQAEIPNSKFEVQDLRDPKFLKEIPDNSFDLGITVGFLMHIDKGEDKIALIKELMRICKNIAIYEGYSPENRATKEKNEYVLTLEDYSRYNKAIVGPVTLAEKIMKLFYVKEQK